MICDDVWFAVSVNDHQEIAQATKTESDEPLFAKSVKVFSGQGELILLL